MADAPENAESEQPPHDPNATTGPSEASAESGIDIQALADKVYRLMMAEIRLDRARGQTTSDGA